MFAVVFILEYVIGEPISEEDRKVLYILQMSTSWVQSAQDISKPKSSLNCLYLKENFLGPENLL